MKNTMKRLLQIFAVLFFLAGCSHHYKPESATFAFDSITEFSSNKSISLVNTNPATGDVLFAEQAGSTFHGNYREWTDTAIDITKRELTARGMNVADNKQKSLKMSVETVDAEFGFFVIQCIVTMKVETGDGLVRTYTGDNRSPASIFRAADGAVMRAVAEMLRDQEIVSYLKK